MLRRWLTGILAVFLGLQVGLLQAGQGCTQDPPKLEAFLSALELASRTRAALDNSGAKVALLARVGQDLSEYQLNWSHLGFAWWDAQAMDGHGAWRVLHKLNRCGTAQADLWRQGLLEFYSDSLFKFEGGLLVFTPEIEAQLLPVMADPALLKRLHAPDYNMLAYPFSTRYQQSNQWVLETFAMALRPALSTRAQVQEWLKANAYEPSTLKIGTFKRLGARVAMPHVAFDDQPFGRRMGGKIDTVTADSVFDWMQRKGWAKDLQIIR